MNIFILDGTKMINKTSCHQHIKKVLRLPEYYGNNLDALADCLCEFDEDSLIILMNSKEMRENMGEYGETLIEVLENGVTESGYQLKIK